MDVQWTLCRAAACVNKASDLFAKGKEVDISRQGNVRLLKPVNEMMTTLGTDSLESCYVKQRSPEWYDARNKVRVTGSIVYTAIGCDTLKKQVEHFDCVVSKKAYLTRSAILLFICSLQ